MRSADWVAEAAEVELGRFIVDDEAASIGESVAGHAGEGDQQNVTMTSAAALSAIHQARRDCGLSSSAGAAQDAAMPWSVLEISGDLIITQR